MLRNLHVKNLALIDEMEVEFEEHFNRRNRRRKIIDHRFN